MLLNMYYNIQAPKCFCITFFFSCSISFTFLFYVTHRITARFCWNFWINLFIFYTKIFHNWWIGNNSFFLNALMKIKINRNSRKICVITWLLQAHISLFNCNASLVSSNNFFFHMLIWTFPFFKNGL